MGGLDLQFAQHVLGRIASRQRALIRLFLQREDIIGLNASDELFIPERADYALHRTAIADTPAVKADPDQRQVFDLTGARS